jgi:hypothetical protein
VKRKRNFFRFDAKKCDFFALFRIDAKHRNLKRNEKETKRKLNEKEAKLPSSSLRSEMKRNGSKIIFASMRKKVYKNAIKRKK